MHKRMMCLVLGIFWLFVSGAAMAEGRRGGGTGGNEGAAAAPAAAGVVNINEATPEQLEVLPGIGPSKAKAIADHRKSHPFKRVEELTRIKGIGKKTFAKLRPMIACRAPPR